MGTGPSPKPSTYRLLTRYPIYSIDQNGGKFITGYEPIDFSLAQNLGRQTLDPSLQTPGSPFGSVTFQFTGQIGGPIQLIVFDLKLKDGSDGNLFANGLYNLPKPQP